VILGYADDSESLRNARIDRAALVTLTSSDVVSTKVAFSARQLASDVAIIATADKEASVDILELSGCSQVLQLREMGITVIGVWERGQFSTALPQSTVEENTVLVLAGPRDQLDQFEDAFRAYNNVEEPVVILGGGRVGWDTARSLEA
jgi:voltage-gated potassium channel